MDNLTGRICVFTGSRAGDGRVCRRAGERLDAIGNARYGPVYGGGKVGLMTVIADTVLELGDMSPVYSQPLVSKEVAHLGLSRIADRRFHARAQSLDGGLVRWFYRHARSASVHWKSFSKC